MDRGQLYYLPNARDPKQKAEMAEMEKLGICIFCPESLVYEGEPRHVLVTHELGDCRAKEILLENNTWVVLRNEYPYDGTLIHVMLVPRRHIARQDELSPEEMADYLEILELAVDRFDLPAYSLWSRNGDPSRTGATIYHLHMQLAVGDPDSSQRVVAYLS